MVILLFLPIVLFANYSPKGLSKERVKAISNVMNDSKLAISFTDWFSISMELYAKNYIHKSTILLGGFHGLSDLPEKAGVLIRPKLINIIKSASKRINYND